MWPLLILLSYPYQGIVKTVAERYEVDEDLIKAVIQQESGFSPKAVSPKDARGLMQVLPETGKRLGVTRAENLFDPEINIYVGTKYLKQQIDKYGDLKLALAAYNCGPDKVDGLVGRYGNWERIKNKLPKETQDYVSSVLTLYRGVTNLKSNPVKTEDVLITMEKGIEKVVTVWGEKSCFWKGRKLYVRGEKIEIEEKESKDKEKWEISIVRK